MAGRGAGTARDRGAWERPRSDEWVDVRTSRLRDIAALKAELRSQDLFEVEILDGELERQGTLSAEVIGHGLGVALGVPCVFSASASNSQAPCI